MSYFDDHTPGSVSSSLSSDPNLIEVGLAEKVGTVSQAVSMMISSFVIALTRSWKLALATFCIIPYIIIFTGLLTSMDAKIESNVRDLYSKASTFAEEALSSPATIISLGAVEKFVNKYNTFVKKATSVALWRGPLQACTYGNMWLAVYSVYALALFYGSHLRARDDIKNGGTVITYSIVRL